MDNDGPHPDHAIPAAALAERLGSDRALGLSAVDAAARMVEHRPNELDRGEGVSPGRILLGQLTSPMIVLLAAAALVALASDGSAVASGCILEPI